jgi:2-polyprenyl-3-methyl-5-hydroxy-6-metoxy-1,4-benzoquinol methylase
MNNSKKLFCKVCGSERNFHFVVTISNIRKNFDEKSFDYYSCDDCSFYLLQPEVSKERLDQIYSEDVYYETLSIPFRNPLIAAVLNFKTYESNEEFVIRFAKAGGTLLDIGCGNGEFSEHMKNAGFDTYGMDPFPVAVEQTKKRLGEDRVFTGYISELKKNQRTFDVITMWHVLEHVDDPQADAKVLHDSLNEKGLWIFEVPNGDSFPFALFGDDYCWNMVPEHIQYFTVRSVKKLVEDAGFTVRNVYTPPRALLNFALSLKRRLERRWGRSYISYLWILGIPLSLVIGILSSFFNKGEVIRVVAQK